MTDDLDQNTTTDRIGADRLSYKCSLISCCSTSRLWLIKQFQTDVSHIFYGLQGPTASAAARSDKQHSSVDNITAAVWLHRFHEAKAKEVKQVKHAPDQFLRKPSITMDLTQGVTLKMRSAKKWIQFLAAVLSDSKTPMSKLLVERPHNISLSGAETWVITLRSRVRMVRKYVSWRVRPSEPYTRGALKCIHQCLVVFRKNVTSR